MALEPPLVTKSLSLCGGLLKAATLIGCVKAVETASGGNLDGLVVVSGSSSGAVIAALVAIGWSADDIATRLIDDTRIVGDILESDPLRLNVLQILWKLWKDRGLDTGAHMYAFFDGLFGDLTFEDVKFHYDRDLLVTASCYSPPGLVVFSRFSTPHLPIKSALRATAAYPGLVLPADISGRVYYDGGLLCNLPLRYADELFPETRDHAVGFQFDFRERDQISYAWEAGKWPSIVAIAANIVSLFFYRIAHLDAKLTHDYDGRVIRVPSEGHDTTDVETKRRTHSTKSLIALHSDHTTLHRMRQFGEAYTASCLEKRRAAASVVVAVPAPAAAAVATTAAAPASAEPSPAAAARASTAPSLAAGAAALTQPLVRGRW